jgi:hypothetical protein
VAIIEYGTDELDVILDAEVLVPDPVVDQSPVIGGRRALDGLNERLSGWWAAGLAVAWIAIFTTGVALEPAPANPDAPLPLVETILVLGLMAGWVVMAAGFAKRVRCGAAGSFVAAVFLVGMTIACPVSGHHTGIGAWWWFELAGSTALVGLSGRALRSA